MAHFREGSCPVILQGHVYDKMLADLRHAYQHLIKGTVKDGKEFADGLIAPSIRALEEAQK